MKKSFKFAVVIVLLTIGFACRVTANINYKVKGKSPATDSVNVLSYSETATDEVTGLFLFMANYDFLTDRLKVIHPLLSEDNLRMVAFYLILKRDNRQGYFHSYKVSNTNVKCSQRTFDKYLKQCVNAGLIRKYKHSFALVSMHNLTEEEIYSTYDINFSSNIQKTVYELRKLIFRLHDRKQVYSCNKAISANIQKMRGGNSDNVIVTDCFKHESHYNKAISYKRIGQLIGGYSVMTAKRMIDLWIKDSTLIKIKAPIKRIATYKSYEQYQQMVVNNSSHTHLSYNNGKVFEVAPNLYSFTSNYTMDYIQPTTPLLTTQKCVNENCAYQNWDNFTVQNFQWA
jgi:hypothetical protein